MVFQLRPQDTRPHQYPNAQDPDFLGYDRDKDRWKVDASGIKIYASGIQVELDKDTDSVSVWSASGTPNLPVYLVSDLDYNNDSVAVMSSSGTPSVPVYLTNDIQVSVGGISVSLDKTTDSVSSWSASGTEASEVWVNDVVQTSASDPMERVLIKKRIFYNASKDPISIKEASIATPSGSPCIVKELSYDPDGDVEYIVESYGTW